MARKPYVKGEYKVMCDIGGSVRYASQTRMNWKGERVCSDTWWEPRNPQEMPIRIPKEDRSVPDPRPWKLKEEKSLTDWSKL